MITSKQENNRLWNLGCFGNTWRGWATISDALHDESYHGPYTIRSYRASDEPVYGCGRTTLLKYWALGEKWFYVNEAMPAKNISIQGEVMRDHQGLQLFYSVVPCHMREALRKYAQYATGLVAKLQIETRIPNHAQVIWDLLDEYPEHVVEFSAFDCGVGMLGWPLIIWEVRAY